MPVMFSTYFIMILAIVFVNFYNKSQIIHNNMKLFMLHFNDNVIIHI